MAEEKSLSIEPCVAVKVYELLAKIPRIKDAELKRKAEMVVKGVVPGMVVYVAKSFVDAVEEDINAPAKVEKVDVVEDAPEVPEGE